ncbi:MAG: protein kinase [Planctomycetota bacterium]
MTTPSRSPDDFHPSQQELHDSATRRFSDDETPRTLASNQPHPHELPPELTASERDEAAAALEFLQQVRTAASASQELPDAIGRYRVLKSLGRGGFAEVFLADDPDLDRRVALKVPLFNISTNDEARLRFDREARLAAMLGHPQIIPVYEYGSIGPLSYIAFAWCDGCTLADWMESNSPTEFGTAAQIISHLADALQHAHQRGIVHRDLKPGNILLEESAEESAPLWLRTRIADFGLARSNDLDASVLTHDGRIVGTPAYMSPEQASSRSDVGVAADIWALGMMLFELLTGELPFRRGDLLATARAISESPVPSVRSLRPDVPRGLDAIVDLCLRKEPDERYPSAQELADDLRRWLSNSPVRARPLSPTARLLMWTRRNPLLASLTATTILSLGIGLTVAVSQRNQALANLAEAEKQTNRADGNLRTAQVLIDDIVALEKRLAPRAQFAEERTALVRRAAELQVNLVRDELPTPDIRYKTAATLQELSTLLGQLQEYDASIENAQQVLGLLNGLEQELPDGVTRADLYEMRTQQRIRLASNLNMMKRTSEATAVYEAAEAEPVPKGMHPLQRATWLSEMRRGQAILLAMQGNRNGSAMELRRALQYFDDIAPPQNDKFRWNYFLCLTRLHTALGLECMALSQQPTAAKAFDDASNAFNELTQLFPEHPILLNQGMQLAFHQGTLSEQEKQWKAACDQYSQARTLSRKFFLTDRQNLNAANFYLLSSVALCRCQAQSGTTEVAQQTADETLEVTGAFPDRIQQSPAYKDNVRILRDYATSQESDD